MKPIIIRKSKFNDFLSSNIKYFKIHRTTPRAVDFIWVWFKQEEALSMSGIYGIDIRNDIFLDDYFEDLDNPTGTELSLLELQHNIKYVNG